MIKLIILTYRIKSFNYPFSLSPKQEDKMFNLFTLQTLIMAMGLISLIALFNQED